MSRDGTIACLSGSGQNARSLILYTPDWKQQTIALAMPRFTQSGDAYFSPDGKLLSVAGATGAGADGHPEQYGTDIVTVRDASILVLLGHGPRGLSAPQIGRPVETPCSGPADRRRHGAPGCDVPRRPCGGGDRAHHRDLILAMDRVTAGGR